MRRLEKHSDKDFTVLNLSDPQLSDSEWQDGHPHRKILEYTVTELVRRTRPDLITVSGDLAWAGHDHAYDMLASLLDGFGIPWAPVWGNHDNQNGDECVDSVAERYMTCPNCIYEKGDRTLGNGNYVIGIEQDGAPVTALILLDSHHKELRTDKDGTPSPVWARLWDSQVVWYRNQIKTLKEEGYRDAAVILHIPIYAYCEASAAAYRQPADLKEITVQQAEGSECWNERYTDSTGVQHENICCCPEDDGMLSVFKEEGLTKLILAGHDHINNWIIRYRGIQLAYSLKAGAGWYWDPLLNGGTVLKINSSGIYDIFHEFVDVSHLLDGERQ